MRMNDIDYEERLTMIKPICKCWLCDVDVIVANAMMMYEVDCVL